MHCAVESFYVRVVCQTLAEASCVSQILTAAAVAEDLGLQRAARTGVQQWAKCKLNHSERDVHITLKRQKTKLDIPVQHISCDGVDIPWISPESWLKFVVDRGLWPTTSGCSRHDYAGAINKWIEFWKTYQELYPTFQLFGRSDVDYSRTAAWVIHGDEGRTLKRNGILTTSLQSVLGFGYDEKRVVKNAAASSLQVNFAGHSLTTRRIVSTIPKSSYESQPEVFHATMDHVARSCAKLLESGYVDKNTGERFRVCVLGVKGDAPYLAKCGRFYRTFNSTVQRGDERGPPKGVCPLCLAGTNLCPAEEVASTSPKWLSTVGEIALGKGAFSDQSPDSRWP